MANASFLQSSFLGGIWSPSAQGRMHDPAFKTALNECLNSFPTEEGAWLRRPGFRYAQHTRRGAFAVLRAFDWTITQPYQMEFTGGSGEDPGHLRFFQGLDLVKTNDGDVFVSGVSTATPAMVVCAGALPAGWADDDTVMFSLQNVPCGPQAVLCNRQFTIQDVDTDAGTFTLQDPITGADIDGSLIGYVVGAALDKVEKVFELATPYTADELEQVRILSDDSSVLILHPDHQPQVLTAGVDPAIFAISAQDFEDGPWLDTNTTDTTLTLSAATGSVTVTASSVTGINGGLGFKTTDVGRLIRFQGGPPLWVSVTSYNKGDQVTGSDGNIYIAQGGLSSLDPTLDDGTHWVISSAHVNWIWLKITAWTSTTVVTADVKSDLRTDGSFATVQGNTNIRAAVLQNGKNALVGKLSQVDFAQFFAAGQTAEITNGAFTDGGGGDISGTYTIYGQFNDSGSDDVSYLMFTDDGGQTAAWTTIAGLSDSRTADYSPDVGQVLAGDELTTSVWRMGAYSDTTGWPNAGGYLEGRRWLTAKNKVTPGPLSNRVDASMSPQDATEDNFNKFSPTGLDGTVADDNAITAVANAKEQNEFFWMEPLDDGLILGAQAGEWLVRASASNDPISPSSIQMRRVTAYGCANVEPQFCGKTTVFVQRQQRRILDIANYPYGETSGWYADNLDHLSDVLTGPGIAEIRYQQTPSWNLWMRDNDGGLVGSVFRHSAYGKDSFNGWHRHVHGGARSFVSISTGPSFDGLSDTLYAVSNQTDVNAPDFGIHWVECLSPVFDSAADECSAFHVDGGVVLCCTSLVGTAPNFTGITIYGLWHLNGQTVQPFFGGLDLGDYTVANGAIAITFADSAKGRDAALFTLAYFQSLGTCDLTGAESGSTTTTAVVNENLGSLEAFVASGSPVGYTSGGGLFFTDPDVPYVVGLQGIFPPTDNDGGIQVFNNNTTHGDEVGEADNTALFGGSPDHVLQIGEISRLHPNGNVYCPLDDISNRMAIACLKASDQTLLGITGVANGGFGSDATYVATPFGMAPVVRGDDNYLVTCGITSAGVEHEVAIWNVNDGPMVYITKANTTEDIARVCEGERGRGDYYVLGSPFYDGSPSTSSLSLYEAWAPSVSLRLAASVAPADIDATWTHTTQADGPGFDAADGNLLFFVITTDTVTNKFYLVKVDRISGDVLWSSALANAHSCDLTRCTLNGLLQIFDSSNHNVISIDLSDGTQTTTAWNAGLSVGTQYFDGSRGCIVCIGSYTQSTGPIPTLIGDYFGSSSTVSSRVLEIYSAANLFSTETTTTYDFYGCVGLTYTSDAQLLRPDFGPDAGTQAGPAFGKMRRIHKAAMAFVRSRGVSVGTDFSKLNAITFKTAGGALIPAPTLYSGTVPAKNMTINDDYGTESKLCWRITRPYPAMVTAVSGMIQGQDE